MDDLYLAEKRVIETGHRAAIRLKHGYLIVALSPVTYCFEYTFGRKTLTRRVAQTIAGSGHPIRGVRQ